MSGSLACEGQRQFDAQHFDEVEILLARNAEDLPYALVSSPDTISRRRASDALLVRQTGASESAPLRPSTTREGIEPS
jgi:hypothetical protein